ncbi:epithelial sodium channel subunit gamma-like [Rhipicephalus microplus]|uniref:epithelial sodium channel subunit gamma-like n=1 Tax=Rhipicephalus microplus TaxID=6941 RepID=UPI003F6D6DAB
MHEEDLTTWGVCKQKLRDLFGWYRERVASAGCSGCDVLLGLSGGAFRRLCWLLAVSLLVGLTLREWARVFGEYHQYGVFTSVHYGTQTSLPFPDVTVCNVNPIRRSALCKDRRLARREAVSDRVWWRECDEPAAYYEPNLEDAALQSELWLWMARKRRLNRSVVRNMGHQLRHMLVACRLGNNDCMHTRYVAP